MNFGTMEFLLCMLEVSKFNFCVSENQEIWYSLWIEFEQVVDRFKEKVQQRKCLLVCLVLSCKILEFLDK